MYKINPFPAIHNDARSSADILWWPKLQTLVCLCFKVPPICGDFAQVRNNCFHVDNMRQLFQDIHINSIMTFLRQINIFNKIYLLFLKSCFILHLYQNILQIS